MPTFHIFFPVPSDKIENLIVDKKSGEYFVKNLIMILDRIDCERNTQIFIDLNNKKKFIDDYNTLENLLSINIRIGPYNLEEIINNFIFANTIKISSINNVEFDYRFPLVNSFLAIDSTFEKENQQRVLNRNDFRHCENHPLRIHSKSPLIGGINGFDNANSWLPSAIGDAKTNRSILINFDTINQNFIIRYEYENFNNQYHAYHIVKNENSQYKVDEETINFLKNSSKGIPRAFKLIEFRRKIHE